MIKNVRVTAWSYSRLERYELCPAKFGYHAKGLKEPEGPALVRGQEVHAAGEAYLRRGGRVPSDYSEVADDMRRMRKLRYEPEEMWCLQSDWSEAAAYGHPEHWHETWLRVKLDAHGFPEDGVIEVADFKTGRVNEEKHEEQIDLYETAAMSLFEVRVVRTLLLYTDIGHRVERETECSDTLLRDRQLYWEQRSRRMFRDRRFAPKPGAHCRYCHYSKSKGGPCRY